jgi:hypothetical protein
MGVDASITSCTSQILSISIRDMLTIRVFKALGKTKINDEDTVFSLVSSTDEKIIWFNVSVNYSLIMNFFNTF